MKFKDIPAVIEKAALALLTAIAKLIDAIIAAIFGSDSNLAAKVPRLATKAEDVLQALAREPTYTKPEIEYMVAHTPRSVLHEYASAKDLVSRAAVDIRALTPEQTDWLFGLSDEDLDKLAKAGPDACEKALVGKKCGIVGLELPHKPKGVSTYNEPPYSDVVLETELAKRVRDFKTDEFSPFQIAT
ncbi:hypothetical protein MRBLMR1_001712 [Neorhizobium sp. LMR1-1-1.1]